MAKMHTRVVTSRSDRGSAPAASVPAFRRLRFTGWDRGMALPWSVLRGRFEATVRSASTPRLFQCLRDSWPDLRAFATVDDLLGYLGEDLSADLDVKDQLYSQLVLSARSSEPASPLAHALLWIGLWPGLSATFFRRLWFWRDCPSELVSEMT